MSEWYKNTEYVEQDMKTVKGLLQNTNEYILNVAREMPGISKADISDSKDSSVTITTNTGEITCSNIQLEVEAELVTLTYKESFKSNKNMTVTSNHKDVVQKEGNMVKYTKVVDQVNASGLTGLFYKLLGKNKVGQTIQNATKAYLEA